MRFSTKTVVKVKHGPVVLCPNKTTSTREILKEGFHYMRHMKAGSNVYFLKEQAMEGFFFFGPAGTDARRASVKAMNDGKSIQCVCSSEKKKIR